MLSPLLIELFKPVAIYSEGKNLKKGLFVDVETTGLSSKDEIIELAMLQFEYDSETSKIHRIFNESSFSKLCQPTFPIPAEITEINGITNEMVEGKSIDEEEVQKMIQQQQAEQQMAQEQQLAQTAADVDEKQARAEATRAQARAA